MEYALPCLVDIFRITFLHKNNNRNLAQEYSVKIMHIAQEQQRGNIMGLSQDSTYKNKFNKEKYDRFSFFMPKGSKEKIELYAKEHGYKSVNIFLQDCVARAIEKNISCKTINVGEINQTGENNTVQF